MAWSIADNKYNKYNKVLIIKVVGHRVYGLIHIIYLLPLPW